MDDRAEVDLFHWNPVRASGKRWRRPISSPVDNFGDVLGPALVRRQLTAVGLRDAAAKRPATLVTVGSVLHLAPANSVIWGTGLNGKVDNSAINVSNFDVRAVRGPLTHDFITSHGGFAPRVFGDPGLLVANLFPELANLAKTRELTVIPNLNDRDDYKSPYLDPCTPLDVVLREIARSEFVVGSSLHAVIIADSLGIPSRLLSSKTESPLKYEDYYLGSGRLGYKAAGNLRQALEYGGEPPLRYDPRALLEAFPTDLWAKNE